MVKQRKAFNVVDLSFDDKTANISKNNQIIIILAYINVKQ